MSALVLALILGAAPCDLAAADVNAAGGDACARAWMDRSLRMNDIAAVGTHNSYKQAIPEAELAAMTAVDPGARGWITPIGRWSNSWTPARANWRSTS
ncbi:phosphatidylinositol-specific phospholipase C1-like protein [Brevundimonas albigilva]|uniref:phosphatidylinositol-specific phospholipase C1-like protein n=1 Tax=Brevundimonas albigilva TaxID=1312364 RepID=UPI00201B4CBD|nr:phosphatidylinositol-specific phospholipase C1-like protein [Brevundimonas albigilva]UQV19933.1 phosphatidylinositol-specific phospholipase C1-like protein [Brevundimonas albigilva]